MCLCRGDESCSISFLSFTVKRGVSAATGVRIGTGGESAFSSKAPLSFCLGSHRESVKAWQPLAGDSGGINVGVSVTV